MGAGCGSGGRPAAGTATDSGDPLRSTAPGVVRGSSVRPRARDGSLRPACTLAAATRRAKPPAAFINADRCSLLRDPTQRTVGQHRCRRAVIGQHPASGSCSAAGHLPGRVRPVADHQRRHLGLGHPARRAAPSSRPARRAPIGRWVAPPAAPDRLRAAPASSRGPRPAARVHQRVPPDRGRTSLQRQRQPFPGLVGERTALRRRRETRAAATPRGAPAAPPRAPRACSAAVIAGIPRRAAVDHDSSPRSALTRPASSPGPMSPPAGSQSATSTGPGQDSASAQVAVVTPGAALPDVTTVSTALPARRQQDQRQVPGRRQLRHRNARIGADPHVDHRHLSGRVHRAHLGDRAADPRCRRRGR